MKKYKSGITAIQFDTTHERNTEIKKMCAIVKMTDSVPTYNYHQTYLGEMLLKAKKGDWFCMAENRYITVMSNGDFMGMYKPKKKIIPKYIIKKYLRNCKMIGFDCMPVNKKIIILQKSFIIKGQLEKEYPGIEKEYQKQIDKGK